MQGRENPEILSVYSANERDNKSAQFRTDGVNSVCFGSTEWTSFHPLSGSANLPVLSSLTNFFFVLADNPCFIKAPSHASQSSQFLRQVGVVKSGKRKLRTSSNSVSRISAPRFRVSPVSSRLNSHIFMSSTPASKTSTVSWLFARPAEVQ